MTRAVTVRLESDDYERLEAAARQLGILPGTLARMLLRETLHDSPESSNGQSVRAILARLTALRSRLPDQSPLDVVELIREGRSELDARFSV